MAGILSSIFDFRSKEEKARCYEAYCKRIFPYGDSQKSAVTELITALFPGEKQKYLMMHYVLIKQGVTDEEPLDYDIAAMKAEKYKLLPITAELQAGMKILLDKDLIIDEKLEYPSLEELEKEINERVSCDSSLQVRRKR